jgi:YVTN family beta-propeller protein
MGYVPITLRYRLAHLSVGLLGLAMLSPATPAYARQVLLTEPATAVSKVVFVDTATNQVVGSPIAVDVNPRTIAITPDGLRAYVGNSAGNSVSVIDVPTRQTVGSPIPVGQHPSGIAIAPDGLHAYVANSQTGENSVSVIDTRTNQTVGTPIPVGTNPTSIAITPDGARAYVGKVDGAVSVIDLRTNQTVGQPIAVSTSVAGLAITPDGSRLYVTNNSADTVSVIDTATNQVVGSPIPTGNDPEPVAITPDGSRVIVGGYLPGSVTIIDTATNQPVGSPLPLGISPSGVAITPDGTHAYLSNDDGSITGPAVLDVRTGQVTGGVVLNQFTSGAAVVPDQPPRASFTNTVAFSTRPVNFNAASSTDPDGTIARYDWSFGDGSSAPNAGPAPKHTYSRVGAFQIGLTLTDNEGCSTAFVFTGQTASCSGGPVAAASAALVTGPARPALTRVSQSARRWRAGATLPRISRRHRVPVGTTFRFTLNESARVRFAFTQARPGRRVGRRCVPRTKRNGRRRACKRTVTAGVLTFNGHRGANHVRFKGRVSRRKKLRPGKYTLVMTARDSGGVASAPRRLSFTIVKR